MSEVDSYALDTEFHRERTYFAHLALVQIGWGDEVALVDATAVDVAPLQDLLAAGGTMAWIEAGHPTVTGDAPS